METKAKVLLERVMELTSRNNKLKKELEKYKEIVRQLKGLIEMLEQKA